ncbi:MAG: hypothetical protein B6I19_10745 [Bacteroidetes bacterium 4572_114]|nr:MAG: hypothetical protein B6I19_10745 [Bacteroidetes bacterium 4572_114]
MEKKLINTHDKFFKSLFSRKKDLREFVSKTISPEIVKNLKLDTLILDKTEYLDKHLRTSYSDLVYNCRYGNSTNVKISLLFEHKSQPELFPHFQLIGYMLSVWGVQIKQKQNLTVVIPIIFYHGKKEWQNKPFEAYFNNIDEELKKYIPSFDYELIDTSTYSDKELVGLFESLELQIGLLVMKNIFNEQEIIRKLSSIFVSLNQVLQTEQGRHFFDTIITYMLNATSIDTNKYLETMRNISEQAEQQFVSTATMLRREGIQEGIQEGMKKGMEKGLEKGLEKVALKLIENGYDNQIIIEITNLSVEKIEQLRKYKTGKGKNN